MRLISLFLAVIFLLGGVLLGALNPGEIALDFYRWQLTLPMGAALIAAALLGVLMCGLLLWFSVIWPLRRRVSMLHRRIKVLEDRPPGEAPVPVSAPLPLPPQTVVP